MLCGLDGGVGGCGVGGDGDGEGGSVSAVGGGNGVLRPGRRSEDGGYH